MGKFSTGSAITFGWETFKKRPWFFVGVTVLVLVVSAVINQVSSSINSAGSAAAFIGMLVNVVCSTLLSIGVTNFSLAAHDSPEKVDISSLWYPPVFWSYLGAIVLVLLAVTIGFILLIIPGIIVALMFMLTRYLVVDRKLGPIEAMKESHRLTRGYKWQLLGFVLAIIGLNLLGLIAFLVGLFVTMPITLIAFAHVYRRLSH